MKNSIIRMLFLTIFTGSVAFGFTACNNGGTGNGDDETMQEHENGDSTQMNDHEHEDANDMDEN